MALLEQLKQAWKEYKRDIYGKVVLDDSQKHQVIMAFLAGWLAGANHQMTEIGQTLEPIFTDEEHKFDDTWA